MNAHAVTPSMEDRIIAASRLVEALTALERRGKNLVTAIVGDDAFVEQQHYPDDEIVDPISGAQFFLHAHRGHGESAHIHCFLRAAAFRTGHQPRFSFGREPSGLTHVAAVALDSNGRPSGLFTTNLWVTEDDWYSADTLIDCLDHLSWDHAPGLPEASAALTSLFVVYRPVVQELLRQRDRRLEAISQSPYGLRELADENFDILSRADIDLEKTLEEMRALLRPSNPRLRKPSAARGSRRAAVQ